MRRPECTLLVSASPKPISAAKATHMDSTPICALSCCSLGAWTATLLGAKPETPPTIIIMSAKFRVRVSAGQTPDYVRLCQPTGAIVPASGRRGGGGGGGDLEICNFMGELVGVLKTDTFTGETFGESKHLEMI